MKQVTVTRYYSIGKDYDLEEALKRLKELVERHPDRAYDLEEALKRLKELVERHPDRAYELWYNTRAFYQRVTVVQVKRVTVDVPEEGIDYTLLPKPKQRPGQSYGDWSRELSEWRDDCERRKGPDPFLQLQGGLNR